MARESKLGGRDDADLPIASDPAFKDKFQTLRELGSGGMGIVYEARQLSSNERVAIKTLRPALAQQSTVERFQREALLLSKLRHPNIVSLIDSGTTNNGAPFMVLQFIEGVTLADLLTESGQIATNRVMDISVQVANALAHAHQSNILHRDIKPSNVMLTVDNNGREHVYVTDFGIGKLLFDQTGDLQRITQTGQLIGSPAYMSPEQARSEPLDARSDLSLGCVMYEALTGSPPFISDSVLGTVIQHKRDAPLSMPEASMVKRK